MFGPDSVNNPKPGGTPGGHRRALPVFDPVINKYDPVKKNYDWVKNNYDPVIFFPGAGRVRTTNDELRGGSNHPKG